MNLTQRGRESSMPQTSKCAFQCQKEDYLRTIECKLLDMNIYFSVGDNQYTLHKN